MNDTKNNPTPYYLGNGETGEPLDAMRFSTEDDAYDYCATVYGEDAWNDTAVLMRVQQAVVSDDNGVGRGAPGHTDTTLPETPTHERLP